MASLSDFSKKRVAVFGDVMVDTNVYGTIERLNPEDYTAPIILVKQKTSLPGGAANVAANITSLSGQASLYGVIGKDESGSILERMCGERNIAGYLRYDPSRRTTLKTRIFEQEGHQCMRIDEEDRHSISASLERYFTFHSLTDASAMIDAIVLSDYAKGFFTENLAQHLITYARQNSILTLVDPKPENAFKFKGADIIRPNLKEARAIAKVGEKEKDLELIGRIIKEKLGCKYPVITMGKEGMFCYNSNGVHYSISSLKKDVADEVGAGDTVIAALALALSSGYDIEEAMNIANHAAGVVVGKVGTATCSLEELVKSFETLT